MTTAVGVKRFPRPLLSPFLSSRLATGPCGESGEIEVHERNVGIQSSQDQVPLPSKGGAQGSGQSPPWNGEGVGERLPRCLYFLQENFHHPRVEMRP